MGMSWMPVRETSSRSLQWTLRTWMQLGTMSTSQPWLEHPQTAERGLQVAQSTFQPRQASHPARSPSDVGPCPYAAILHALTLQTADIVGACTGNMAQSAACCKRHLNLLHNEVCCLVSRHSCSSNSSGHYSS